MGGLILDLHAPVQTPINLLWLLLRSWTELAVAVPAGKSAVGLHALGLVVHKVLVNGEPSEFILWPAQAPSLADSTAAAIKDVAEHAYHDYLKATADEELKPELVVTLPSCHHYQGASSAEAGQG